jgi:hypothetical protein
LQGPGPSERFGKSVQTAGMFVLLASDESALTVGSELILDEGLSL